MGNITRYICIKPPTFTFSGKFKKLDGCLCWNNWTFFLLFVFFIFFVFALKVELIERPLKRGLPVSYYLPPANYSGSLWRRCEATIDIILTAATLGHSAFVERYCTLHCGDGQTPHSLVSGWLRGATEPWWRYRYLASQRYCYPTIAPQGYSKPGS